MTYHKRLTLLVSFDSLIVLSAIFFSKFLVSAEFHVFTFPIIVSSITLLISHHCFSLIYKLYQKAWEYASVGELWMIFKAITLSITVTAIVQQLTVQNTYIRLLFVTWMLHMFLIGGSRFFWRIYRDFYIRKQDFRKRTLIIGAGSAGTMVARQLIANKGAELSPVGFIDDNVNKQNLQILGIPVLGGVNQLESIVQRLHVDNIVIAIPSLCRKELNVIFQECLKTKAKTQIIPMLEDLVTGRVSVNQFRDVEVEDLLGREPVKLDIDSISDGVKDKVVLVTGAGGSIGSEICRQLSYFKPKKIILLGHGENSIYSIELELKESFRETEIEFIPVIADLQDAEKMKTVMKRHRPDVVYHAAAHKHVPLMEWNPEEALKNNVRGTMNVAKAADLSGVEAFVMISSDKAVNPTSVMGATKRLAEMIVQHMDQVSSTRFVAVRFGNVLGSRGSVIPLFKKQIQRGGPVTVTHPDMVRYFMTIPEASRLVLQAGVLAKGGEIFVLDMGEPVKIVDLARNLIQLSGNDIEEIGIEFTGIRPGEKLFEELLNEAEIHDQQIYPHIYIGKTSDVYLEEIQELMDDFAALEPEELKEKLLDIANRKVVPEPLMSVSG
ncbi:MAG TPA: nucleoside-diphosphate sugar epimerase/dehydratase [Bacillales bacterium]|nr:nucleoside-diphosphate sugar epimerase/dehydratase [Bacillales bacterium]